MRPLGKLPRLPPLSLEPGSVEYSFATFFQFASLLSASSRARTFSASALVLTRTWRASTLSGTLNCDLLAGSSKYFLRSAVADLDVRVDLLLHGVLQHLRLELLLELRLRDGLLLEQLVELLLAADLLDDLLHALLELLVGHRDLHLGGLAP